MLLPGVLFALITIGFVLPCLIDAARTPRYVYERLSKETWLVIIAVGWAFGATAWLIAGRPGRVRPAPQPRALSGRRGLTRQQARRRHPAGQGADSEYDAADDCADVPRQAPIGPDDDPEFLLELDRKIHDEGDDY